MDDIKPLLPQKPVRFLDQPRFRIRSSGLAYTTEKTYIHCVKRFIYFHKKQHTKDLGAAKIEQFFNPFGAITRMFT